MQIILTDPESAVITQSVIKLKTNDGALIKEIIAKQSPDFIFYSLKEGKYVLEIQSLGFTPLVKEITIKQGKNVLNLALEIEEIKVDVKVERDVLDKRLEEAFSRTWSADEIEALPGNPNDIEKELKRKYGDDIVIRVNGFTGGRLPPKEQIASIKVIRSSFDAEFHQTGATMVDIKTKAGLPKFFGFFAAYFNDSILNARNAFSPKKLPEQSKFFMGFLGGPIIKNKTSFTLSLFGIDNYQQNNIIAVIPGRAVENNVKTGNRMLYPAIGIDHNLSKNHTIHFNYELEKTSMKNLGVGEFNLSETGFSTNSTGHQLRISESGMIHKRFVNEFRMELKIENSKTTPNSRTPSITVLNAFSSGGAGVDNNSRQQKLDAVDNVLFDRGKHSLKFGGEIEFEKQKTMSADNINGKFIFSSLLDYQNNQPADFTQRQGTSLTKVNQVQTAVLSAR